MRRTLPGTPPQRTETAAVATRMPALALRRPRAGFPCVEILTALVVFMRLGWGILVAAPPNLQKYRIEPTWKVCLEGLQ